MSVFFLCVSVSACCGEGEVVGLGGGGGGGEGRWEAAGKVCK